jgi:hypothetical protein
MVEDYHDISSIISYMNLGIICPLQIIKRVLDSNNIPDKHVRIFLNDIMQREYDRMLYLANDELLSEHKDVFDNKNRFSINEFHTKITKTLESFSNLHNKRIINLIINHMSMVDKIIGRDIAEYIICTFPHCYEWNTYCNVPGYLYNVNIMLHSAKLDAMVKIVKPAEKLEEKLEEKNINVVVKQNVVKPVVVKPAMVKPVVVKQTVVRPAVVKPAVVKPAVVKPEEKNIDETLDILMDKTMKKVSTQKSPNEKNNLESIINDIESELGL